MAKKICWANVRVPEHPRVRFFKKSGDPKNIFADITDRVVKIVIEDPEQENGICHLLRYDANDQLIWQTKHPSIKETKWHVEFEYGLPEDHWQPCA